MLVVAVTFYTTADGFPEFLDLVRANAVQSRTEPGCSRFDVCTASDGAAEVFLYEIYDDQAAFDTHLRTPHFLEFNQAVAPLVTSKKVTHYRLCMD
jgi:quinol monooxygenase YgiN